MISCISTVDLFHVRSVQQLYNSTNIVSLETNMNFFFPTSITFKRTSLFEVLNVPQPPAPFKGMLLSLVVTEVWSSFENTVKTDIHFLCHS
jgi:hypothetical protein